MWMRRRSGGGMRRSVGGGGGEVWEDGEKCERMRRSWEGWGSSGPGVCGGSYGVKE